MDYRFKILLVGENHSGKSSFLRRIIKNKFKLNYNNDDKIKIKKVTYLTNKGYVTLEFTDTIGELRKNEEYYSSNDSCIIFYNTLYKLKDNYVKKTKESVRARNGNIPFFFVGTCIDLEHKNLFNSMINTKYTIFYISSKSGDGVLYFLNYLIKTLTNDTEIMLNTRNI